MWRRILLVPFEHQVPVNKVSDIKERLADASSDEARAAFAWAIEGAIEYQEKGLQIPEAVEKATKQYQAEMDPLHTFFEDCVEFGNRKEWTSSGDLRDTYVTWCFVNGIKEKYQVGTKGMANRLIAKGAVLDKLNGARGYYGVRLIQRSNPDREARFSMPLVQA